MTNEKLAGIIAREIFKLGDEPNNPCQRMEFKGGHWPGNETDNGGIGESTMAQKIVAILNRENL